MAADNQDKNDGLAEYVPGKRGRGRPPGRKNRGLPEGLEPRGLKGLGSLVFAKITKANQRRFLLAFIDGGYTKAKACAMSNVPMGSVNNWMYGVGYKGGRKDPDQVFLEAFSQAEQIVADVLEREAIRRGTEGYKKPVYYKGQRVGHIVQFSDTLMAMLLKKYIPAYREKTGGSSASEGVTVNVQINAVTERLLKGRQRAASMVKGLAEPQGSQTLIPASTKVAVSTDRK